MLVNICIQIMVEKKVKEEEEDYITSGYEDIMFNEVDEKEEAGITDLNTAELIVEEVTEVPVEETTTMETLYEEVTEVTDEDTETTTMMGSVEEVNEVVYDEYDESTTESQTTERITDMEDYYYYEEEDAVKETDAAGSEAADNFVKLVPASGEEEERSKKVLWIPIGEDQDITEYQEFTQKYTMDTDAVEEVK